MTFLANTRIAIVRGTTESPLGDEVESNDDAAIVPELRDIPASLIEKSRNVFDPATGTRRTVRYLACRLPVQIGHPDTGVATPVALLEGDRVKDLTTGRIFAINELVAVPRALSGQSSLTLDLTATAAA